MTTLLYYIAFAGWWLVSLLPLPLLYILSDVIFVPVYYVVRYRRRIVRQNLSACFPEKSERERRHIEKEFYRYFCDYMVETIKYFSMNEKQIRRRMTFGGLDDIRRVLARRDCIVYIGHIGNWEWISSLPLHIDSNVIAGQIYHQLEDPVADKLFLRMRERFKASSIEMRGALRPLVRYKQQNRRFIIGFIADQAPLWHYVNMWTPFLNHQTAFFVGAENIAKATNAEVYYLSMKRVKRGYYHADFVKMTDQPKNFDNYELTVDYAKRLEQNIRQAPAYWLWSHNRWKRTYESYLRRKQETQNK